MNHTTRPQDAVSPSVVVSADRAALLREAATRLWHQTNGLTEYGRGFRAAVTELRAMADCPACGVGVEHDVHGVAAPTRGGPEPGDQVTKPARGICPECDRAITLTQYGVIRHHGGPVGSDPDPWLNRRAYRCKGAGQKPKPTRMEIVEED